MFKQLLLVLSLSFIINSLHSQTVQSITVEVNNVSGGGFQGDVTITDDGLTVYSSADVAGVFKSTNGGLRYETIAKGLKSPKVASLAITPDNDQILYAGTGEKGGSGGLFRSINGGNIWVLTGAGNAAQFAGNHSANADPVPDGHPRSNGDLIVVDEGNNADGFSDDIVIAGTYKDGVRIFTGGGEIEADAVLTSGFVRSVARDDAIPSKAYAAIYFSNDALNGIYEIDYSNPSAVGSTLVYQTARPEGLTVLPNGHIYAAVGDGGIAKYDGNTWGLVNSGIDAGNNLRQWTAVTGYVSNSNDIVYAGLNNQGGNSNGAKYSTVWRTENGGSSWTPLVDFDTNVDHTIYGQSYEWWFSTDAFPPAAIGGTNSVVSSIDVARGAGLNNVSDDIIYVSGRGGIWRSENGGDVWNPAVYNMAVTANRDIAVNPNNASQIVVGNTDFVLLETNNRFEGSSISRDKPSGAESRGYSVIFDAVADEAILGAGDRDTNNPGGGEVYLKAASALGSPSGSGWTNTNLQGVTASNNGRVRAVTYGYHNGNSSTSQTILAVVEGEGVFRYHSNNWVKSTGITIPENTDRSNFVWPDPTNSGVVYLLDLDQGLYRSNDGGQSWSDIWPSMDFNNNDFFFTGYITADDNEPTTIYVSIQGRSGSPINTNFKVYRMTGADTGIFDEPDTDNSITDITKHSGNMTIQRPGPIDFGPDGRLWLTQQQNSVNDIFAGLFVMENPSTDTSFVNVTNQKYQNSVIQPSGMDVASDGHIYLSQGGTGVAKIAVQEAGGSSNTAPLANAGPDQTVDANEVVTLDGSGSSDGCYGR